MNWKIILILLLTFTYSCSSTNDTKRFLFNVPADTLAKVKVAGPDQPSSSSAFKPWYVNFNFVVDSSGELFFFQTQTFRWFCGTGFDEHSPPNYKQRHARFYPEDIHWDSSRTRFPPKVEMTDFTPPKLVE